MEGVSCASPERFGSESWTESAGHVLTTDVATWMEHTAELTEEVFGPSTLVVRCNSVAEMVAAARRLEGQLTATIWGSEGCVTSGDGAVLASLLQTKAGRLLFNDMPTGVEVCHSMNHGGPYPACSTPLFTSVGTQSILRFARPMCFQDWPQGALPKELRNENPGGILRLVNGEHTRGAVEPNSRSTR